MTRFYGELSLTTPAPALTALSAMDQTLTDWESDGGGRWQDGPLAIGVRLLCSTPEDVHDRQPLVEPDFVLAGHLRLDDRAALARELELDLAGLDRLPDSKLAALAWRRWGAACAGHLHGDWVLAVWDRQRQRLWLGRDAAGNTGVYYWQDGRRLLFATHLKALLAHPEVPRQPDAYHLARLLTVFHDPAEAGSTAYVGIRRLPGGQALRASADGVVIDRWWRPEHLAEFAPAPDEEFLSDFREVYGQAVRDRLRTARGPVALMLSAGLDSGSVAAFAAPALATRGERLLAFTSVPCFAPGGASATRLGDEGPLARMTARHIGNIDCIPVDSAEASVLGALERLLDLHEQPQHGPANYYWILDILNQARQRGAQVLLTGQGGNATVSWPGTGSLLPDLLGGRWSALIAACRAYPPGPARLIERQLWRPLRMAARAALSRLDRRGPAPWERYSALHPGLARHLALSRRMRAAGHDPRFGSSHDPRDPHLAAFRLGLRNAAALGSLWMDLGAAHRLAVCDPTRDRRVIEFCWRLPDRVFWAQGRQRGLSRAGLADALPAAVRQPGPKGLQAADLGYRLRAESASIRAALERLEAHTLARQWLDIPKMRGVQAAIEHAVTPETSGRAAAILLRGLGVGWFLTRF